MNKETREIIHKVHDLFTSRRLSLSTAESCTGGLISHYLTSIPGASAFFKSGIIPYSEDSKKKILNVSGEVINTFGMVSKETAREMARQARIISETDYAIATTGNLGPDALEGKDTGLIFICVSKEDDFRTRQLRLHGSREKNKEESAVAALNLLVDFVTHSE